MSDANTGTSVMPHNSPSFDGVSDEAFDAIIEFVLFYEGEVKQSTLTGHGRAQMALLRRMLLDLGVEHDIVYDCGDFSSRDERNR